MTLGEILPYVGTGAGGVVLVLGLYYRDGVVSALKVFAGRNAKRDVERGKLLADIDMLRQEISAHTNREESYWHSYDGRLATLDRRLATQETSTVEIRVGLERDHEEVVRALATTNERMTDIATSVRDLTNHLLREGR
jgi:hypothetical protein